MKLTNVLIFSSVVLLSSCAQDTLTGDVVSRSEAGQAQNVQRGRITSIRPIKIEGGNTGGTVVGGLAGGLLGSSIGSGRASNTAGALGGALLGSAAGSRAQQAVASRNGVEIVVRLDQGGSVAVVQEVSPRESFSQGDRVKVLSGGGRTRVSY